MKFQSALVAVAVADIEPLKRLNALVRSRFKLTFQYDIFKWFMNIRTEFINTGLGTNNSYHQS